MLEFILFGVGLMAGIVFAAFAGANMLLPFLYSLPVSLWLVAKRQLRPVALLFIPVGPMVWAVALIALGYVLAKLAPSVLDFALNNVGFIIGQWVGLAMLMWSFLTPGGRARMFDDYARVNARFMRTDVPADAVVARD
jgi:hypothetical protein